MNIKVALGLTGLALVGASSLTLAQDYTSGKLAVSTNETYGAYLTDGAGRALYMLRQDKHGQSNCYDACAEVWPPFVAPGARIRAKGVDKGLIHIIKRKDGTTQVTYDGKPLYYYTRDKGRPGSTKGEAVRDKFGQWYLVAPTGKRIKS